MCDRTDRPAAGIDPLTGEGLPSNYYNESIRRVDAGVDVFVQSEQHNARCCSMDDAGNITRADGRREI